MSTAFNWRGRRVLVTGHTGFKGGWLTLWLSRLGADVHGYALEPESADGIFHTAHVARSLASDTRADIRDLAGLTAAIDRAQPELVIHLAAQALVQRSYVEPLATFDVNVMGTANVLQAVRNAPSVCAALIITTDKCYENQERARPYRETDPLGGYDPYSASKACAEIVTAALRASYFSARAADRSNVAIASARAGNVVGGGDWALGRLVPDCIRAFTAGEAVRLRYPNSTRPWLYVLEPLSGYLMLAEKILGGDANSYTSAFNFGPRPDADANVGQVAQTVATLWGRDATIERDGAEHPHEAGILRLDAAKAESQLGWRSHLTLQETLELTVAWYRAWNSGHDMRAFSLAQIAAFEERVSGNVAV